MIMAINNKVLPSTCHMPHETCRMPHETIHFMEIQEYLEFVTEFSTFKR